MVDAPLVEFDPLKDFFKNLTKLTSFTLLL